MSQYDRSSLFMSLDCGSHSVEDATASQLVLLVSMSGREGCSLSLSLHSRMCYVGQYGSMCIKSHIYMFVCLGVIILHFIVCTAIHNCSSSGSLFFTTLRQNN